MSFILLYDRDLCHLYFYMIGIYVISTYFVMHNALILLCHYLSHFLFISGLLINPNLWVPKCIKIVILSLNLENIDCWLICFCHMHLNYLMSCPLWCGIALYR